MSHESQEKLEQAFRAFGHAMKSAMRAKAKDIGCSMSHFEVLHYIAEQRAVSLKDIALYLGITSPSASSLIDGMTRKRLLKRTQPAGDRRSIRIELTPTAERLLAHMYARKQSVFGAMLAKLTSKDKNDLVRILMKSIS